jgi:hypothetical protein
VHLLTLFWLLTALIAAFKDALGDAAVFCQLDNLLGLLVYVIENVESGRHIFSV